jgi:hypothetical protein
MNKLADLAGPGILRRGSRICALRYRSQERVRDLHMLENTT